MQAEQRVQRLGAVNWRFRAPPAHGGRHLRLPKTSKRADLCLAMTQNLGNVGKTDGNLANVGLDC